MIICKVVNSLPLGVVTIKDYLLILTLTFLIVWRWSLFSLRWPVSQGSRFFLVCCSGTLSGTPVLDDSSSVSIDELFHKYLSSWWSRAVLLSSQLGLQASATLFQSSALTRSFLPWVGEISQRRWKMIGLVLSLSDNRRLELLFSVGSWLMLERKGTRFRNTNLRWRVPLDTLNPPQH